MLVYILKYNLVFFDFKSHSDLPGYHCKKKVRAELPQPMGSYHTIGDREAQAFQKWTSWRFELDIASTLAKNRSALSGEPTDL